MHCILNNKALRMKNNEIQKFSDSWGQAILLWQRLRRPILQQQQVMPADKRILYGLHRHGPCSKKALAKYIVLEHSSLTRSLDRLEQKRFITRLIDAQDNRYVELNLTTAGVKKVLAIKQQSLLQLKKALGDISLQDVKQATRLMEKLKVNMEMMLEDE
jgi:DNA-binding MarR family transcriptional regulator